MEIANQTHFFAFINPITPPNPLAFNPSSVSTSAPFVRTYRSVWFSPYHNLIAA